MPNTLVSEVFSVTARTGRVMQADSRLALPTELFGVELELEQPDLNRSAMRITWPEGSRELIARHEDGSLRNGIELVFSQPYFGETALSAIDAMYDIKELNGLADSLRTSTHVHINYSTDTLETAVRAAAINAIVEPYIVKTAGSHREANCYAVSMRACRFLSGRATNGNAADWMINRINGHRYLGFNVTALAKYGTIEYRYFGGMEKPAMIGLINMLLEQKSRAKDYFPALDKLTECSSIREFILRYLPHHATFLSLNSVSEQEDAEWKSEVELHLSQPCFTQAWDMTDYPEDYEAPEQQDEYPEPEVPEPVEVVERIANRMPEQGMERLRQRRSIDAVRAMFGAVQPND